MYSVYELLTIKPPFALWDLETPIPLFSPTLSFFSPQLPSLKLLQCTYAWAWVEGRGFICLHRAFLARFNPDMSPRLSQCPSRPHTNTKQLPSSSRAPTDVSGLRLAGFNARPLPLSSTRALLLQPTSYAHSVTHYTNKPCARLYASANQDNFLTAASISEEAYREEEDVDIEKLRHEIKILEKNLAQAVAKEQFETAKDIKGLIEKVNIHCVTDLYPSTSMHVFPKAKLSNLHGNSHELFQ